MEPDQNMIEFNFNSSNTTIECKVDEKMKDIFEAFKLKVNAKDKKLIYKYNGIIMKDEELTFNELANSEDKKRGKINILVMENEDNPIPVPPLDCIIESKNIICPKCFEDIKFKFEGYVINLSDCKNKHDIDNIFLNKFNSTQKINISKIICQDCGKYNKGNVKNNIFYRCNNCKKNLCPTCFSNHDKNHKVINYDDKNYICEQHNEAYKGYCKDCKINICINCGQNHQRHNIIKYDKLSPNVDKIMNILKQFEEANNKLKNDIDDIIEKLNNIKTNFDIYYNINKNILNNFNKKKINYEILYNMNQIYNIEIIKDINSVTSINNIKDKFNKLINIYNQMNSYNSINISYIVKKGDNDIKIFSDEFVKNNINNCTMIIDNKEYKISNKFNIKNYNKDNIIIKLKGIKNITNASEMFNKCSALFSLDDISKWNTSNINNMSAMFYFCSSLSSLPDISIWDTSNVNNMSYMFGNCKSLSVLPDISKWNISNVKDIKYIFSSCSSLKSLPDISKWDISNINDMSYIFSNCTSLLSLPEISKWNISNVKNISNMFCFNESLLSLPDISKWNTSNINNMNYLFSGCKSLLSLPDISKWNTEKVNDMSYMFYKCSLLSSLPDISKWNTINVKDISKMFSYCESLSFLSDISRWDTSNLEKNDDMYEGCVKLKNKPKVEIKKKGLFSFF